MTKKQFEKIGKRILPLLPQNYVVQKDLMFIQPIQHLLRGICFERSSSPNQFYVWKFIQYLVKPAENIYLTIGNRLRHNMGAIWDIEEPNFEQSLTSTILSEGKPYIEKIKNLNDLVEEIAPQGIIKNSNVLEAVAFCLARLGKIEQACEKLEELAKRMSGPNEYNMRIPWREELAERALYLKRLLLEDPQAAHKQMDEWEDYTIKNLGLEKYR